MTEAQVDFEYKLLEKDTYHFHFREVNNSVVDGFLAAMVEIGSQREDPETLLRLLVTGPGTIPSLPYMRARVLEMEKQAQTRTPMRVAFVLEKTAMEFLVNAMFQVVSRGRSNTSRIFKQHQYDEALEWLRQT